MQHAEEYFRLMAKSLVAADVLPQGLIGHAHHQTIGEAREEKFRDVLRNFVPQAIVVGRGFVSTGDETSTQIDVLLYSADSPTLSRKGELVVVSPDAVRGIVEIKTAFDPRDVNGSCEKLAKVASQVRACSLSRLFVGLFAFEDRRTVSFDVMGKALQKAADGFEGRVVSAASWGETRFLRYLNFGPENPMQPLYAWRAYSLPETAPSAFVCDLVKAVSPPGQFGGTAVFPSPETEKYREADFQFRSRKWFPDDKRAS